MKSNLSSRVKWLAIVPQKVRKIECLKGSISGGLLMPLYSTIVWYTIFDSVPTDPYFITIAYLKI